MYNLYVRTCYKHVINVNHLKVVFYIHTSTVNASLETTKRTLRLILSGGGGRVWPYPQFFYKNRIGLHKTICSSPRSSRGV